METRTKKIIQTLCVCLSASAISSLLKLCYGNSVNSLAFVADGIHSLFDSSSTILGMFSVYWSSKPPDEGHPYGHQKFETVAASLIAVLLFFAAYEVAQKSLDRILRFAPPPDYSHWGVILLLLSFVVTFFISRFESTKAKELRSEFLAADSIHNQSDIWITTAVLISFIAGKFRIPIMDASVSFLITLYLVYLGIRLLKINLRPLVDSSVLETEKVRVVVNSISGVLFCHSIRSRGQGDRQFLDLNIHLPGNMTLDNAHDLTHRVEEKLRQAFPGLVDVVIHTEPHGHKPCSKD